MLPNTALTDSEILIDRDIINSGVVTIFFEGEAWILKREVFPKVKELLPEKGNKTGSSEVSVVTDQKPKVELRAKSNVITRKPNVELIVKDNKDHRTQLDSLNSLMQLELSGLSETTSSFASFM